MTLDEALDIWHVDECDELNVALSHAYDATHPDDPGGAEHPHPTGWWAVSNDDGICAYFANEGDAFRFRLAEINRALNG